MHSAAPAALRPPGGELARIPVDGAKLLDQAFGYLAYMAYWPSLAAQVTGTLFAAQAGARDEETGLPAWLMYEPRLFVTASRGGCGKSWITRLIASLCPSPKRLAEMTKASLIDLIAQRHTVVITELDKLLGTTGKRNPWLPGLANVGYEFDGATSRKQGGAPVEIPLYGAMILDGRDSVRKYTAEELTTLFDRCIIITVDRAPDGYRPPRYDLKVRDLAASINGRLARWMAQEVRDGIAERVPAVPAHLGNRPFNLWEPLFAVAEAAGGHWPDLCAYACENIESAEALPHEQEDTIEDDIDTILSDWDAPVPSLPD